MTNLVDFEDAAAKAKAEVHRLEKIVAEKPWLGYRLDTARWIASRAERALVGVKREIAAQTAVRGTD